LLDATKPYVDRGIPVVGLEPSCLLTTRDELPAMRLGADADRLAGNAFLLEELLARDLAAGHISGPLARVENRRALLHGHCHQKSFGVMGAVEKTLSLVEGLTVETVESSCCGMAGAFGYGAETYDVSMAMGELSLLPAVRKAPEDTAIVADGFSCRHQIADGTARKPRHVASILADALRGQGNAGA
jgi:Fe-S oxidoreductase